MVKLVLAYVISFFLGPTVGGVAFMLVLPLLLLAHRIGFPFLLTRFTGNFISGFTSVYFATLYGYTR
jgi:branched-subunit amino acid ABC-type transport system permease component